MKNRYFIILIILSFLILLSTSVVAKYCEEIKLECKTGIGVPIIIVQGEEKILIEEIKEEKICYHFSVLNYQNEEINKANIKYKIILESEFKGGMAKMNLLKENGHEYLYLENNKTEYISVPREKDEAKYILELEFEKDKRINGKVNVKVEVIQEF